MFGRRYAAPAQEEASGRAASDNIREVARKAVDAGADIVVAHDPHVLQTRRSATPTIMPSEQQNLSTAGQRMCAESWHPTSRRSPAPSARSTPPRPNRPADAQSGSSRSTSSRSNADATATPRLEPRIGAPSTRRATAAPMRAALHDQPSPDADGQESGATPEQSQCHTHDHAARTPEPDHRSSAGECRVLAPHNGQARSTASACGPRSLWRTRKRTRSPATRGSPETTETCTKRSGPPASGVMKPKPRSAS
ncbi:capsule synthesis protein PGA_cap [Lentzea xinjiangensis]|uniref:Capsule synthesis protein PGA_cap n=1 Tax=Lentzea xinjiangensis TaxID=402600 RepID=A0A1H9W933_9PSEU|nr:capsule synthesis protein PGA_cap [Lentzea xinjiangensis]